MSKNVAVFVDVANIFYAAKAAGVDIDYVTLLKASTAGRDLVRAYAYTGLDPENENQRQFHAFLGRSGYKVVSKDIRKYGDGRIKANLDIELVVDMMRMGQHIDIAVVVSGDGDFAPAIRAVQQLGVRVEVVSFRGNTSSDLIDVADVFTDIAQLARVEKGDRSGRRVASEDDLSMTAVPEKETDNGVRRRRGEGRRGERGDRGDRTERPERTERPARGTRPETPVAAAGGASLVALPGERLSRVAPGAEGLDTDVELEDGLVVPATELDQDQDQDGVAGVVTEGEGEGDGRRRRRRRGGRGRGRGRRAEGEAGQPVEDGVAPRVQPVRDAEAGEVDEIEEEFLDEEVAPLPQHSTFGSVWESQLGPRPVSVTSGGLDEEPDEDEPEIPEYLLAERRQQGRGRNQRPGNRGGPGNRGSGQGYRSAVDRERYGRGSSGGTGFASPGRDRNDRRPERDRSAQGNRSATPPRQPRPVPAEPRERVERPAASAEPWSEVPVELQEMLRAELARKQSSGRPQSPGAAAPESSAAPRTGRSRRGTPATAAPAAEAAPATAVEEAPARPTRRRTTKPAAPAAEAAPATAVEEAPAKPTRRRTTKPAAPAAEAAPATAVEEAPAKPTRRRTTKATATTGEG